MVNQQELIKKLYPSLICKYLSELRDGLRRLASQCAIIVQNIYIIIILFFFIALGSLFLMPKSTETEITSVICTYISVTATFIVCGITIYASQRISDASSQFFKKFESLLHNTLDENKKQNEIMIRRKIFDEVNTYYIAIGDIYREFVYEHYPYKLNVAFSEYVTKMNGEVSNHEFIFMNFIEHEKMMTIKVRHMLRSSRFYFDSIYNLILSFDDYLLKFNDIAEMQKKQSLHINAHVSAQYVDDVKNISKEISEKFLKYISDIESLLDVIENNSISLLCLNIEMAKFRETKNIIRKKLHEEYARRGTSDE